MSEVNPSSSRPGSGTKPSGMWQPPTLEDMQAMLPQYQFLSLLGRGGMGAVYKAVQVSLDRAVAVKVLPGDLIDDVDSQFAERFKNEARTMAKMNHPAIVNVYDFGETQTGLLFIVMEFIDGTDVSKMIISQGKLPEDYALSITAHVCDALAYAHRHGVIHRDIKPANILINMDGAVKVADFGLAKQSDSGLSGLTKTNMAMGTPDFVAPEALIPGVPLDGRADLYAIGVMLYQMLTGEIPRGMWTMPGMKLGTDPRFDAIIGKAMQTDREVRYQSAAELRRDLDTILTTPRALTQPQPQPAATPAQKPQAHGPKPPQGQKPAEKPLSAPPPPKKANLGMIIGLGATAVLLIAGYFILKPPPPGKNTQVSPSPVASAPVSPQQASKPAPTAPPSTAPVLPPLPSRAAKQTLDLLALTDPLLDRVPVPERISKNEWKREGGELVYLPDGKSGKLAAPVVLDCRDYEIEFKAKKHSGNDRIHLDIPLGGTQIIPIILNSPEHKVLTNKHGGSWWGGTDRDVHVSIRVINPPGPADRIRVQQLNVKGNPLADWSGDLDSLARPGEDHPAFPKQPVPSVYVVSDKYAVQMWTLRVFEGEAKVLRGSAAGAVAPVTMPTASSPATSAEAVWAGWTGPNGGQAANSWRFEGGAATSNQRTTLWSPESFGDFELELEWKVGPRGNGGVFYHVSGSTERGSPEMQLSDPANTGGVGSGGLFGIQAPSKDLTKLNEWQTARLVVRGAKHEHWINGELVLAYDTDSGEFRRLLSATTLPVKPDFSKSSGKLVLQCNAGEVAYRNLKVRQLLDAAPMASAPATPMPVPVTPSSAAAPASNDPVALKLADLEAKFQAAFERDAGVTYKAQIAKLNTGYATALDRALAEAAKAGRLDDAVALREEKQRVAEGKGLPPEDLDTLPEALKKLRATWRGAEAGYAKQRDAKAAPLFDAYDKALAAFQTELTQQNKIDEALRVKATRDALAQRRGSSAPAAVETPATAKAMLPAPASSTTNEASSSWRKAAEWVLGVGGEISIRSNSAGPTVFKDAKDLPSGRFDILGITIDPRNGKNAEITDDDFTRFNGLRDIELVRMAHLPSVTGSGFAAFAASAETMESFAVYNAPLQPQHLGFITQFKNLRLLELNRIPSLPSESLTKIQMFKELTQLRLLGQMKLDDKALLALAGLTKLTDLFIPGALITDEGLVALKDMTGLIHLELTDIKGLTGAGLVHLTGAKNMLRLLLTHTAVDDAALAHLSGLTKLRDLALHQTAVTDAGIRHLAPLKELRSLDIATQGITGVTLNELSGCKELTKLSLYDRTNANHGAVNDAGLHAVAASFPKLEEFTYVQRQVTDAGLAHLSALKLRKLSANTAPGIEGLRHLAEISTLESLELGRSNLTDEGLALLAGLKFLQTLSSFDAHVTDEGLKHLQTLPALKSVTFSETKITQAGLDALMKARPGLRVNK